METKALLGEYMAPPLKNSFLLINNVYMYIIIYF
jgi:hypothetical protein